MKDSLPPLGLPWIVRIQDSAAKSSRTLLVHWKSSSCRKVSEIAALCAISGKQDRHIVRDDLPHAAQVQVGSRGKDGNKVCASVPSLRDQLKHVLPEASCASGQYGVLYDTSSRITGLHQHDARFVAE